MNRWQALVSILVLLFIGISAYLVVQLTKLVQEAKESAAFMKQYSAYIAEPQADLPTLPPLLAEARRLDQAHPTLGLQVAEFDLSLRYAGAYPDDTLPAFRRAIALGRQLYDIDRDADSQIGLSLDWAYLAAGLPEQVARWNSELIPHAPDTREQARLLEADAALARDDAAGARAVLDNEVRRNGGLPETQAMAVAGYIMLRDYADVPMFEHDIQTFASTNPNYPPLYAQYLIDQRRFDDAAQLLDTPVEHDQADLALWMAQAVVFARTKGMSSKSVQELIARIAGHPLAASTPVGIEAAIAARLWQATGDATWWEQLTGTARRHPADPSVLTALAQGWTQRAPTSAQLDDAQLPLGLASALAAAQAGAKGAQTAPQQVDAQFRVVEAACIARPDGDYVPGSADIAITALEAALGDPAVDGHVANAGRPWYEDLIVEPSIVKRRAAEPDFDRRFHQAIVEFNQRRRALFQDLLPGSPEAPPTAHRQA